MLLTTTTTKIPFTSQLKGYLNTTGPWWQEWKSRGIMTKVMKLSKGPNMDTLYISTNEDGNDSKSDWQDDGPPIHLPRHIRATCHAIHLIATTDIETISNRQFKNSRKKWTPSLPPCGTNNLEVPYRRVKS